MAAVKDKTVETFIEPVADVLTTTQPIVRKCGSCGQPGHTWRTCKKDNAQQEAVIEQVDNYDAFLSRGRVAGGEI